MPQLTTCARQGGAFLPKAMPCSGTGWASVSTELRPAGDVCGCNDACLWWTFATHCSPCARLRTRQPSAPLCARLGLQASSTHASACARRSSAESWRPTPLGSRGTETLQTWQHLPRCCACVVALVAGACPCCAVLICRDARTTAAKGLLARCWPCTRAASRRGLYQPSRCQTTT